MLKNVLRLIVMHLAGNSNLTPEDDARAENDAAATESWGSG